jgi:hypothetical protein
MLFHEKYTELKPSSYDEDVKKLTDFVGKDREEELLIQSVRAGTVSDFHQAEKKARKALSIRETFAGHIALAAALLSSFRLEESACEYAKAAACAQTRSEYLYGILSAFNGFKMTNCEKAGWWKDEELLCLSKEAVEVHKDHPLAWDMRAYVLAGEGNWSPKRTRTASDFRGAAFAFLRHSHINHVRRQELIENAHNCIRIAIQRETGDNS